MSKLPNGSRGVLVNKGQVCNTHTHTHTPDILETVHKVVLFCFPSLALHVYFDLW
jgi:hypothetical protein